MAIGEENGSINFAEFSIGGGVDSTGENALMQVLMFPDIQPGADPSYEICKTIYLYHPLGAKMAEAPITMAQSQERDITIQDAPDEVKKAFIKEWAEMDTDNKILYTHALARVYGISAIVMGIKGVASDVPLDLQKIWDKELFFNVLDPLNAAGSLVLSQNTNDPNYQKPVTVRTSGDTYHPSRFRVVMNEQPIFIAYTNSAFGFVGRSVYQRTLYPLKSFIRSMIADDMIQTKLGALIAKQEQPGSIVNRVMTKLAGWKRSLLKRIQTGQVLSIGINEEIETLDMTNVDTAGTYSRKNILKNIATGADMPAKLLENETMVEGFGEGTEDAKKEAQYINRIRIKLRPMYRFFDNICQYRAWNPQWYKTVIQNKYEDYKGKDFEVALSEWREAFHAEWPSLLIEPESEEIKKEEVKLEAVVAILNVLLTQLDPDNKTKLIQWAADCFGENKRLFPHELEIDWETLGEFQQENQDRQQEMHEKSLESEGPGGAAGGGSKAPKFGDAAGIEQQLERLRQAVERMQQKKPKLVAAKAS